MDARLGVLEYRDGEFIRDVMDSLSDLKPEFVKLKEIPVDGSVEYRVIIDRLSFQDRYLREYVKHASLSGCYVINNPFASEVNNKPVEMQVCSELGIPFPKTMMLPLIKDEDESLEYVTEPDWSRIQKEVAFPAVIKPHDGSAWEHVYEVASLEDAKNVYNTLRSKHVLLLQKKIEYTNYYRAYCISKNKVLFVKYEPAPYGLGKYLHADLNAIEGILDKLEKWTIRLNERIDFDFNSVEWCIDREGKAFVIDAFNEVPDMDKNAFPKEEYQWIVDNLTEMVRGRFNDSSVNKTFLKGEDWRFLNNFFLRF